MLEVETPGIVKALNFGYLGFELLSTVLLVFMVTSKQWADKLESVVFSPVLENTSVRWTLVHYGCFM